MFLFLDPEEMIDVQKANKEFMEKSEVSYLHHSNNIETRELLMTWCTVLAVFL